MRHRNLSKIVKDTITMLLTHPAMNENKSESLAANDDAFKIELGVNVEARRAKLGDFARQQLDAIDAVAEDHRLIDLQL